MDPWDQLHFKGQATRRALGAGVMPNESVTLIADSLVLPAERLRKGGRIGGGDGYE
jgi:hypothetical protein